ncbi:MAG: GspE/PulE family protein [Azonexus sp.]|nr:GspE/PulE family protein [Azonexus sp.]MCK6413164.1 GspE/PulE family protein [Azonexus sp.]
MTRFETLSRSTPQKDDFFLASGLIDIDQHRIAAQRSRDKGQSLRQALLELGFIQAASLRQLETASGHPPGIDWTRHRHDPRLEQLIPRSLAVGLKVFPLRHDEAESRLLLVGEHPEDLALRERLRHRLPAGTVVELRAAAAEEIEQAIDRHYGYSTDIDRLLETLAADGVSSAVTARSERATIRPLLDAFIADAVRLEASDIHFEPEAGFARIRYRIDGLLRIVRLLPGNIWQPLLICLKLLAGMDIADSRSPQDGRFTQAIAGREVDFRVASLPTLHGENLVLRIHDRQRSLLRLDQLGLDGDSRQQLERICRRPEGILVITGPTGSGKTTTLYSLLHIASHPGVNTMTLEDPVEHPLPLIRQTQVCEAVRLDFANGIRSLLRQDPDIVMVGEIRDAASASMAFRAAMTGHQVYTTLHANSALAALPRLLDLGISPATLAGSLNGIVAQRLLRRLCPHCRRREGLGENNGGRETWVADGCPDCDWQGYRGRLAVMEIIRITPEFADLIAAGAPPEQLRQAAFAAGYRSLAERARQLALDGSTTLAEAARIIDLDP